MERILHEGGVIGVGLGNEDVFSETRIAVRFRTGRGSHADEEGGVIAATYRRRSTGGLIGSADIEGVPARGRRWLADVEIALHPFEAKRDFMLTVHFVERGACIAVHAGIKKQIVVGR